MTDVRKAASNAEVESAAGVGEKLEAYYARQIEWSRKTFGPNARTGGVIQHIRKELMEIEAKPDDLSEWVDVIILSMDGFWRHGGAATDLMPALLAKQVKNFARSWPDWRTMSEDRAIEHDRSGETARADEAFRLLGEAVGLLSEIAEPARVDPATSSLNIWARCIETIRRAQSFLTSSAKE